MLIYSTNYLSAYYAPGTILIAGGTAVKIPRQKTSLCSCGAYIWVEKDNKWTNSKHMILYEGLCRKQDHVNGWGDWLTILVQMVGEES